MFGSVPVFGDALADAFASIAERVSRDAPTGRALRVRLKPSFGCLAPLKKTRDSGQAESVHPNVVQVVHSGANEVTVHYSASRVSDGRARAPPVDGATVAAPTTVAAAAKAHVRSEETVELAAAVASLAWNAERVVQAVMAALASADTDDFDAIELSLTVPPDDRGGSPWYTKPDNPLALAQRKRKRARLVSIDEEIIRRLATYHVDLLRAFVNDLVQNRDEYNLMSLNAAIVGNLDRLKNAATPPTDLKPGDAETDDEYYKRVPLWSDVAAELQRLLDRLLDMVVSEEDGRTVAETLIKNIASQGGADQLRTHIDKTRESLQQASATIKNVEDRLKRLLASADMRGEFVPLRLALRLGRERAPPVGDASAALRPRHALVGALGVGMAMLDPLVGNALALRCGTIRPDASGDAGVVDAFRKAFAARVPLRLSEACVVVCSRV